MNIENQAWVEKQEQDGYEVKKCSGVLGTGDRQLNVPMLRVSCEERGAMSCKFFLAASFDLLEQQGFETFFVSKGEYEGRSCQLLKESS